MTQQYLVGGAALRVDRSDQSNSRISLLKKISIWIQTRIIKKMERTTYRAKS